MAEKGRKNILDRLSMAHRKEELEDGGWRGWSAVVWEQVDLRQALRPG